MNHHATAIEWNNLGMIFVGPSGSGKSSLALDLIEEGAMLVADDQIILSKQNNHWIATCPEMIRNRLHLNNIGLLHLESKPQMKIDFIFQSDRTTEGLSKAPDLGLPVITMDFFSGHAKDFLVKMIRSFDLACTIP